jgi:broad specificity phosphatase PhoE
MRAVLTEAPRASGPDTGRTPRQGRRGRIAMTLAPRPFLYLRHGETDWNRDGLCLGRADRPLTGLGRRQARAARPRLSGLGISAIFHSPLERAAETACILGEGLGLSPVAEPALSEACLGEKEGCPETDPEDDFIARWLAGGDIPGAEPYDAFRRRVVSGVNRCLLGVPDGLPLLVAHYAVYAALSDSVGYGPGGIGHCIPSRFEPHRTGWSIRPCGRSA